MTKFDSFIYLKDHPLAGLKSPEKKRFTENYPPLLDNASDNASNNTTASPAKPAIVTKNYSSKYN
jgi:hypothetical protein